MKKETIAAVAPYAVWMILMFACPATAESYAWRSLATLVTLLATLFLSRAVWRPFLFSRKDDEARNFSRNEEKFSRKFSAVASSVVCGLLVGLLVCFLWIWPEQFACYREWNIFQLFGSSSSSAASAAATPSPYEPSVCGWPLTLAKLCGSAFVIAPVEELFFRSFLYRWLQKSDWSRVKLHAFQASAFCWMVFVFALEHHTRLAAGAMAGAFYGLLAIKRGVGSAILAHVVTNLVLAIYVIYTKQWNFW